MALPIITNVWRVAWEWANEAHSAANIMHFQSSAANAAALYTQIDGAVVQQMFTAVAAPGRVQRLRITKLDGISPTAVVPTIGTKWSGLSDGEFSPATSALVSTTSDRRGQASNGRVYLPFIAEDVMESGSLSETIRAEMEAAWLGFITSVAAAGATWQVTSYGLPVLPATPSRPERPAAGPLSRPVQLASIDGVFATQRPRQSRLRR